jgi:glyoxylase-like metal-dependent hydrolase (beta-lactamase superfamily II)
MLDAGLNSPFSPEHIFITHTHGDHVEKLHPLTEGFGFAEEEDGGEPRSTVFTLIFLEHFAIIPVNILPVNIALLMS